MKRLLLALALVAALVVPALAEEKAAVRACTKDAKIAVVALVVADNTPEAVLKNIAEAFAKAAGELPFVVLQSFDGYKVFQSYLSEDAAKAILGFDGVPQVIGSCSKS